MDFLVEGIANKLNPSGVASFLVLFDSLLYPYNLLS